MPPATTPIPPKAKDKPAASTEVSTPPELKKTQKKYKFRLLAGMHVITEWVETTDPETGRKTRDPINTIYQADKQKGYFPTIETDVDLDKFNSDDPKLGKKYQRIHGSAVEVVTDPTVRLAGETIHAYMQRMSDLVSQTKSKVDGMLKDLDKMTQDELIALAVTEEIDLSSCKNVEEVRKVIREGLTS